MPIALFPLVNEIRFGGNPRTLGLFLSAVAVGGITAGLLSGTVTHWRRSGLVQLSAAGIWGLALACFGLAGPLWLALGCLAVAGAADTVSVVTRSALVQLETPDAYWGRVSSVEHVIGVAGPELGNFRGGLLASVTSAPSPWSSGDCPPSWRSPPWPRPMPPSRLPHAACCREADRLRSRRRGSGRWLSVLIRLQLRRPARGRHSSDPAAARREIAGLRAGAGLD